jgi:hypothetical protein
MAYHRVCVRGPRMMLRCTTWLAALVGVVTVGAGCWARTNAETTTTGPSATPLVFDRVTVVDVEHGQLIRDQRVVIVGNRIRAMGQLSSVRMPAGAQVVDASGKYLIPGFWDMHAHPQRYVDFFYPLFIINGVTGIRDAASPVPLDTQNLWRREILSGTLVGPPRQLLSGPALEDKENYNMAYTTDSGYAGQPVSWMAGFADAADGRHLVDSLKAAGANIIKTYDMNRADYFVIAAEARRLGIPFGGHLNHGVATAIEASDSGAGILDHNNSSGDLEERCLDDSASVNKCRPVAERFRHNNTWWVPTYLIQGSCPRNEEEDAVQKRVEKVSKELWAGEALKPDWLRDSSVKGDTGGMTKNSSCPHLRIVHSVGLPIMSGLDVIVYFNLERMAPGFSLHGELAKYVAGGLTPLEALQAATLNPAKFLHGTDSLGTVAPGKLADLVLLDSDPLADITNTTAIRAVVANGRYFDRAALDQLLADVQAKTKQERQSYPGFPEQSQMAKARRQAGGHPRSPRVQPQKGNGA